MCTQLEFSSFTHIGKRDYQEDVLSSKQILDRFYVFVVCDGHGGSKECASFVSRKLIRELEKELSKVFESNKSQRTRYTALLKRCVMDVAREWDVLTFGEAILSVQTEHQREIFFKTQVSKNTPRPPASCHGFTMQDRCSGTTVTAMLIDTGCIPVKIAAAYLGDSRFALKKDLGNSCFVSKDHVPLSKNFTPTENFPSTHIQNRRLNGILSMTHAIGDNTPELYGVVKREPSTFFCTAKNRAFICLGTDGFWEVFRDPHETLSYIENGGQAQRLGEMGISKFVDNASFFCVRLLPATRHRRMSSRSQNQSAFRNSTTRPLLQYPPFFSTARFEQTALLNQSKKQKETSTKDSEKLASVRSGQVSSVFHPPPSHSCNVPARNGTG